MRIIATSQEILLLTRTSLIVFQNNNFEEKLELSIDVIINILSLY